MTKATVTINKKAYKLNKGIGFFRSLGILPKKTRENIDRLGDIVLGLKVGDAFVVSELLIAGLTEEDLLSNEQIEDFVFSDADVEKEAAKLLDFLKQTAFSGLVNQILEDFEANMEKAQMEMEKPLS